MILWPGVLLTAVLDGITINGIYNSQLLQVVKWDNTTITMCCFEGGDIYTVSHAFLLGVYGPHTQ